MEIEAKYGIPDEQIFRRLREAPALAGFDLGQAVTSDLHDTYLDTPDRAILAGGYACRLRQEGNRYLVTVKGLGDATGGIHRRDEFETELPGPLPPRAWPSLRVGGSMCRPCSPGSESDTRPPGNG